MIKIMFTCDRCKRKKELKGIVKEDMKELYNVHIYHHGEKPCYTIPLIKTQLCPECKSELEKWLGGKE